MGRPRTAPDQTSKARRLFFIHAATLLIVLRCSVDSIGYNTSSLKDAKTFECTEFSDVCPAQGFRLLQPSVAQNHQP
jgi:hypothetical protein